jgi:hypothetical protein
MLQSRIHALEDQVARLTSQKAKLLATDKKQRTTGSILFKNVESATTVVNSNWHSSSTLTGMTITCLYDKLLALFTAWICFDT